MRYYHRVRLELTQDDAALQNRFTVPRAALEMSRAAETIKVRPVQVPGPAGDVIGYRREDRASGSSKPRFFALEMNANEIVPFIVGGARFRQIRLDDPLVIQLRELSRVDADLGREANRLTNRLREQLNEKDCIRSAQALKR